MDLHGAFHVYDTTLRDGAQQEGLNLSVADKLTIARQLDGLGGLAESRGTSWSPGDDRPLSGPTIGQSSQIVAGWKS